MATVFQQSRWAQKPPSVHALNRGSPQAKGLIAYWPVLNNDTNRIRNVASAGDAYSANGWKKGGGLYGPSALLNGTSQHFVANGVWPSQSITFCCRAKFNTVNNRSPTYTDNSEIFQRDDDANSWGFQMQLQVDKLQFFNVWGVSPGAAYIIGATAIVVGKWYHIAATYNVSTFTGKIYLNGVQDASGQMGTSGNIRGPGTQYSIGATSNAARRFDGFMEDIRVYNRALSQAEISDIYRNPMSVFINQNNIMYAPSVSSEVAYDGSQFFSMF